MPFECKYCSQVFEKKQALGAHVKHQHLSLVPAKIKVDKNYYQWGRAGTEEREKTRREKLSLIAKQRSLGGYIEGSGRGKKGSYKGIHCDSTWELAFLVYHLDHNSLIKRCGRKLPYFWKGKEHFYYPDFEIGDTIFEIKGYLTEQWKVKHEMYPNIVLISKEEIKPFLEYAYKKYGKNLIRLYTKHTSVA